MKSLVYFFKRLYRNKWQIFLIFVSAIVLNYLAHNLQFFFKEKSNDPGGRISKKNLNKDLPGDLTENNLDPLINFDKKNNVINDIIKSNDREIKQATNELGIKYPNLLDCQNSYNSSILKEEDRNNYNNEAHKSLNDLNA